MLFMLLLCLLQFFCIVAVLAFAGVYYRNKIRMYNGFKPNQSMAKSISSVDPTETQLQTLQREVDNYTRKLEQEKRKYFGIQDSLKSVTEEYEREKGKLNELKKQNSKAHNVMLHAKVKNLQANLDKAISTYNDTVAHNNKLKSDVDMLRRQKKNYMEMLTSLEEQISRYQGESHQKLALIQKKKRRGEQLKQEIMSIKSKNQQDRSQYIKQFESLEKDYMSDKRDRQTLKFQKNQKPQSVDTQPLLKQRLKKIVSSNKQKLKIIEQYKRQMRLIEEAFDDIKQKSGISTLEQITNTFIKSQEQNYALYNYMDQLSRNIDSLEDQNRDLQAKIATAHASNQQKRQMLQAMTEEEKNKAQLENYMRKKEESVRELNELVDKIKPVLGETLMELAKSKFNQNDKQKQDYQVGININQRNIEEYLADLEKYINVLMMIKQDNKIKGVQTLKEGSVSYSKPLPALNEQDIIREKNEGREENRFIDHGKFKEFAYQYLQRRKNKGKEG